MDSGIESSAPDYHQYVNVIFMILAFKGGQKSRAKIGAKKFYISNANMLFYFLFFIFIFIFFAFFKFSLFFIFIFSSCSKFDKLLRISFILKNFWKLIWFLIFWSYLWNFYDRNFINSYRNFNFPNFLDFLIYF